MATTGGFGGPSRGRPRAHLRSYRGRLKLLTGVIMVTVAVAASAGAQEPVATQAQELATLLKSHEVVSEPSAGSSRVSKVRATRPLTRGQTVLPVTDRTTTDGVDWLRVMVPGRPNGRQGWIEERGASLSTTSWRVVIKTSSRRVLVHRQDRLVRSFPAIVGKPSTPTPHGQFFVEESIRMPPGSAGAPFALALSARSHVLKQFGGGPGQIAMHGLANIGGRLGTAVSHGCVRLANRSIRWMARRIAPGVPVEITP